MEVDRGFHYFVRVWSRVWHPWLKSWTLGHHFFCSKFHTSVIFRVSLGALFVRDPETVTPLYPIFYGGGQERNFRPGTENTGMIAGLGEASQLVVDNLDQYHENMKMVRECYASQQLSKAFSILTLKRPAMLTSSGWIRMAKLMWDVLSDPAQRHQLLDRW